MDYLTTYNLKIKQFLYLINLINMQIIVNNLEIIGGINLLVVIVSYFRYYSVKSFNKNFVSVLNHISKQGSIK